MSKRAPFSKETASSPGQASRAVPLVNMQVRSKVWIEVEGKAVLSDYRAAILEGIDRTGSLAKAAEQLKVPYRTAWQRLKESEEVLGLRLVETQSGGADGGGSSLTPTGRELLRRYRELSEGLEVLVDGRFREAFG